jgi:hypothetical protein
VRSVIEGILYTISRISPDGCHEILEVVSHQTYTTDTVEYQIPEAFLLGTDETYPFLCHNVLMESSQLLRFTEQQNYDDGDLHYQLWTVLRGARIQGLPQLVDFLSVRMA